MNIPKLTSYCDSEQAKVLTITSNDVEIQLYFSYETIIAFRIGGKLVCCENVWTRTTGKHLGCIESDPKKRVKRDNFLVMLENACNSTKFSFMIESGVVDSDIFSDPTFSGADPVKVHG